jgi:hypothetical protein
MVVYNWTVFDDSNAATRGGGKRCRNWPREAPAKGCPQKMRDFGLKNPISDNGGHVYRGKKRNSILGLFLAKFRFLAPFACITAGPCTFFPFPSGIQLFDQQSGVNYIGNRADNPICGQGLSICMKNTISRQGDPKFSP